MVRRTRRWSLLTGAALLAAGLLFTWVGCSTVEPMGADDEAPSGTMITNPADGASLNRQVVNVRGHAEVGATLRAYVNGLPAGSAQSWPAGDEQAPTPFTGNFTIEDVNLGEEGPKLLGVLATDLYGNPAADTVIISVTVDTTRPPVVVEQVLAAEWVEEEQYWETNKPSVTIVGRTDTSYDGVRILLESAEYGVDSTAVFRDSVRFWAEIPMPPLMWPDPDTLGTYLVQSYDAAENVSTAPTDIYWNVTGRDTVLAYDDGDFGGIGNKVTGGEGQGLAVRFEAPAWASYVTQIHIYIMNDNIPGDPNPNDPTTAPIIGYVWKPEPMSDFPGDPGNSGMNPGGFYPEVAWLEMVLPNAVDITDPDDYPNKNFFAGMEWLEIANPFVGEDSDNVAYQSYFFNDPQTGWSPRTKNTMIRAVVSDVPYTGEKGARTATIYPARTAR